jgi:chromate transporter
LELEIEDTRTHPDPEHPAGIDQPGVLRARLVELARLFLGLGFTAFGGPAAHIAMYQHEVVGRRKWMSEAEFMDLLGATNLIPGPNSTEMTIHIGYRRAGWRGMLTSGVSFILPATLITLALSWAYVRLGTLPQVEWLLGGVEPVVLAIVAQALWALGRKTITSLFPALVGVATVILYLLGVAPLWILFGAALVGLLVRNYRRLLHLPALIFALPLPGLAVWQASAQPFSYWRLFLTFLKIGSVLYGSGYVLLAFLQADFVERLGWLTQQQLLDAVAIGQVTPGPVFSAATFIGYILGGMPGALLATLGIFLPSFVFVALSNPLIPRIRSSPWASGLLDGVNYASLGLMAGVLVELSQAQLNNPFALALALISLFLLLRFRMNTTWLILGGALAGWLWYALVQAG